LQKVLTSLPASTSTAEKKERLRLALRQAVARDRDTLITRVEITASQLAKEKLELYTSLQQRQEEILLREALEALI
jgi:hypothetical protein